MVEDRSPRSPPLFPKQYLIRTIRFCSLYPLASSQQDYSSKARLHHLAVATTFTFSLYFQASLSMIAVSRYFV